MNMYIVMVRKPTWVKTFNCWEDESFYELQDHTEFVTSAFSIERAKAKAETYYPKHEIIKIKKI